MLQSDGGFCSTKYSYHGNNGSETNFIKIRLSAADLFVLDYNRLHQTIRLTNEISERQLIMLDADIHKGENFLTSHQLDVRLFEKAMAAHLFIPPASEHPPAVIRASIKGNLIRLVKRSSRLSYFLESRSKFYERLRARYYGHTFLQTEFARVSWCDRRQFLHLNPAAAQSSKRNRMISQADPVTLAVTLPYTQRTATLKVEQELFSISKRLLIENTDKVPDELRSARFRLARKMGNKIGQKLLTARFPREDSTTRNLPMVPA